MELFLPDALINTIEKNTNSYAATKPTAYKTVTAADILLFFSITFYMGVVKLPGKADYWERDEQWPLHFMCRKMSFHHFQTIWKILHLSPMSDAEPEGETNGVESRRQQESEDETHPVDDRWYAKAALLIDQVNKVSKAIYKTQIFLAQ